MGATAAGARTVDVAPERLAGWLERFSAAHGPLSCTVTSVRVDVGGADGTTAGIEVPFPPLAAGLPPAVDDPPAADLPPYAGLLAHVVAERTVGVLLVRRGGYGAGVFRGARLVDSKVGSRLVQGRAAAGGWSQQRFARRRDNQARQAFDAAAEVAARVLLPHAAELDAVVSGGDRRALASVLGDPRLAVLRPLLVDRVIDVPDPRLRVLQDTPRLFRAVRIHVVDGPVRG